MPDRKSRNESIIPWMVPAGCCGELLVYGDISLPRHLDITRLLKWPGRIREAHGINELKLIQPNSLSGIAVLPNSSSPSASIVDEVLAPGGFIFDIEPTQAPPSTSMNQHWGFLKDRKERLLLVNNANADALKSSRTRMRSRERILPLWWIKRRMESVVHLSNSSPTRFDAAMKLAIERHGPTNGMPYPCVYYQKKGKLTTFIPSDLEHGVLLKAPLTDLSTSALTRADTILTSLDTTLPSDSALRNFLPRIIDRINVDGQVAWVETKIPGVPLSTASSITTQLKILDECARIIREFSNIQQPPEMGWSDEQERDNHLSSLARSAGAETEQALTRVLALLRSQNRSYLRKGDMTMSNVLVMNDQVSGIIDWDESGHSAWPLAPLADLILSWTWQREGLHRHQGLALLLSGDSNTLASGLDIHHLLEITGFDWPELAFGGLCSTLDHAHHELKHLDVNLRKSRLLSLLVEPLAVATKYLDDHGL